MIVIDKDKLKYFFLDTIVVYRLSLEGKPNSYGKVL